MTDENELESSESLINDMDEFEDILSEITPDESTSEEESEDDEDDDESVSAETVSQTTKKPSRWKRKVNYLTEAKARAEKEAQAKDLEIAKLRAEADEQRKFITNLFNSTGEQPPAAAPASVPSSGAPTALTEDEIERRIAEKVNKTLTQTFRAQSENQKLAAKWNPHLERVKKELSKEPAKAAAFVDWFGNFVQDVDSNSEKRLLLSVAGNLEYAAETLYTINKSQQFRNLPLDAQINAVIKLNADIASKRKKTTGVDKTIERPKGAGAGKKKTFAEMTPEEWYEAKMKRNRR